MPSQAWITAANRTDKTPVLHMSIESVKAKLVSIYDRAGWEAGPVKTNINTSSALDDAGVVIMVTDGTEAHGGTFDGPVLPLGQSESVAGWSETMHWTDTRNKTVLVPMECVGTGGSAWVEVQLHTSPDNVTWTSGLSQFFPVSRAVSLFYAPVFILPPGTTYARVATYDSDIPRISVRFSSYTLAHLTSYVPTAFTQTKSIDLGAVPSINSIVGIQDDSGEGRTLSYTARGSNDNAAWTNLGAVVDGTSVAPYRYYDFTASFASDGPVTPVLKEIGVSGGDDQFRNYSTHEDTPVAGAKPYLQGSISPLNTKLELMKLGSIGEVSPKLFLLRDTFELLRDGYLRNKLVQIRHGFLGLASQDYEPIFTGLWYDGSIDFNGATISVKTRSIFSRFSKVQLPPEKALGGVRDDLTCPPWEIINHNIITTMLDVVDLMGIPDRYIDRASFTALSGGVFNSPNWNVSRRIDKDNKEEATKLLEELSVLSGVFLLQQPDGKISAQLYDPAAAIEVEISTDYATFGPLELGQAELFTRQQILYNPKHAGDLDDGVARGTWVIGRTYAIGELVIDLAGRIWHCWAATGPAASDSQPGQGTAFRATWMIRWQFGDYYSEYEPRLPTSAEKRVVHAGTIYTCIAGNINFEPGVNADWATHWTAGAAITVPANPWDWAAGMDFKRSDTIYRAGVLYRCLIDHQSAAATEPLVGAARRAYWSTEWATGKSYVLGDTVTMEGPLFTCIDDHVSSAAKQPTIGLDYRSVWYSAPVKKSSSDEDFYNAYVKINNLAEINWGLNADVVAGDPSYQANPGYQKNWQEKWNATNYARGQLANRMDEWFANPKMRIKASDLPPRFWAVGLGKMVGVTGLMLPSAGAVWGIPCYKKKFMVTGKTPDPALCTTSFDLLEV